MRGQVRRRLIERASEQHLTGKVRGLASVLGKEPRKLRFLKARTVLECSRNRKEASMTGAEGGGSGRKCI